MTRQDTFLIIAAIASVLGLTGLTITGIVQYHQDATRFQNQHQEGSRQ